MTASAGTFINAVKKFFSPRGRLGRLPWVLSGILFFAVKFQLDSFIARLFGRIWSPINYLEPSRFYGIWNLPQSEWPFYGLLVLLSVPFICAGVVLTVKRLRDAALPTAAAVLFFVPMINLLFFLLLALMPPRWPAWANAPRDKHEGAGDPSVQAHNLLASGLAAIGGLIAVFICIKVIRNYGWGLFIAVPFAQGVVAASLVGVRAPQTSGRCLLVSMFSFLLTMFGVFILAMDGFLCILMALPAALPLVMLGSWLGYLIQREHHLYPRRTESLYSIGGAALIAAVAADFLPVHVPLRTVTSEIQITATPEQVWKNVVAFPPLAAPHELLFRAGIAYPKGARIEGTGAGAIRYCDFNTGSFVEPIQVWDPPRRLAFSIAQQPYPMKELSPWAHIHPPHLDDLLRSQTGEFLIEPGSDGVTRLQGTTCYNNRMYPQWYWGIWSDWIIHRIHMRVLEHIRNVSEEQ